MGTNKRSERLRLEATTPLRSCGCFAAATLFMLLANMVVSASAQSNTTDSGGIVSDRGDSGTTTRPIDQGLRPLYIMTKIFLEKVVQPRTLDRSIDIDQLITIQNGQLQWQEWTLYLVGFVVCIIIGILFIIIMPIVGFCFCCCRCCGNCGGKAAKYDPKHAKCKRFCCGTLLMIFSTFMLAGVICAFMTNELLREQTTQDNGLLPSIRNNLASIDAYKDNTVTDLSKTISKSLREGKTEIMNTLKGLPEQASDELGKITNASTLLKNAETLADSLTEMRNNLGNVSSSVDELKTTNTILSSRLESVHNNITEAIKSCFDTECNNIRNQLNLLSPNANFSQTVDDVKEELDKIQSIYSKNLPKLISKGKESFENVSKKIRTDADAEIAKADGKLDDVISQVNGSALQVISQVNEYNLTLARNEIRKAEPEVKQYGEYISYVGIGLSCVILLICLLYYLGLMFGACGERPYEDATICNKGVGAQLFMAGVGFSFLFCWILMLVTTILFAAFGLVHTEVCRYLVEPQTPSTQEFLDSSINDVLHNFNISVNVSQMISGCKNNQPIYQALNLESMVHLKDRIDLKKFDLDSITKSIMDQVGEIPDVTILSDDALKQLENLEKVGLENINFTSYFYQMDKELTAANLTAFASELDGLAKAMKDNGQTAMADQITAEADELRDIQATLLLNMTQQKDLLKANVMSLKDTINEGDVKFDDKVKLLVNSLTETQNTIKTNGTALLKQALEKTLQTFINNTGKTINTLLDKITNSVGRCRPLYTASTQIISSVCVTFLYPLNGFWFALGWCLFFFIPSIIVAVKLAGLYRKTEPYDPYAFNKAFDDPNYDAYQGVYPGDHIPLEEVDNKKNYRNGQGVQNRGFESGDYRGGQPSYHRNGAGTHQLSRGYGGGGDGTLGTGGGGLSRENGAGEGYHPPATPSYPSSSNPPYHYNARQHYY